MHFLTPGLGLWIHTLTPPLLLWVLSGIILGVLFYARKYHDAVTIMYALFATTGTVAILKIIIASPRPEDALVSLSTFAFPSGHAASAMFLACILSWLLWEHLRKRGLLLWGALSAIFFAIALLVGYSRILIGVHTYVQVIAGFAIGLLLPAAVIVLRGRRHSFFFGK